MIRLCGVNDKSVRIMKKILNYSLLAIFSVAALVSCAKTEIEEQKTIVPAKSSIITFKATPNDVETKATLTPNAADTEFTAAWEDAETMVLNAVSTTLSFDEDATATWSAAKEEFSADFGEVELPTEASEWDYKAWYPAKSDIPFGESRFQMGNSYNSDYDIMYGELNVPSGKIGKDASDNAIVVGMNRLTGIAYFHITGGPDENVIGATLSTNENLAAETVTIAADGASLTPTNGTNIISLSFLSAPNAQDFKLWFNVLPGSYTGLTLTIYTATKKATISASAITFTAGKLSKVKKNITTWTSQQYYSKVTAVGGLEDTEYLVVYEPDKVAFNSGLVNPDVGNNVISVTKLGNYIPSTAAVDAAAVTIKDEGESKFSVKTASELYIGRSAASNGMDKEASVQNNTISFSSENALIAGTGGYQLRFNPTAGASNYRFRYYASDKQQPVALYKFVDTRIAQSLSFPQAAYDATYPGTFDAPVLSGANTSVTYSTSNSAVAGVDSGTGAITINGIGSATITATAAADATYKKGTASYTLTVASAPITTIAILKANLASTSDDFDITLTDAVVTGKYGNNAYIQDGSAGIYVYNCADALSVGDKYNGDISVSGIIYSGQPEITAIDVTAATKTTGAALPLTTVALATLVDNIDDYDGMRVKVEGLQLGAALSGTGNAAAARGASSIKLYSRDSDMDLAKDDIVDVIGFPVNYGGTTAGVNIIDDGDVDVKAMTWNLIGIEVTTPPTKTSYVAGEYFSTAGMVVTATYEDSTDEYEKEVDVTASCTYTPSTSTALTTGDTSITIEFGGESTSQAITVASAGVSWTRVTTVSQITSGGTFIIGYEATAGSGVLVPMRQEVNSETNSYVRSGTTAGSSTNGTITMAATMSAASTLAYETVIAPGTGSGKISIKVGIKYIQDTSTSSKNQSSLTTERSDSNGTDYSVEIGSNDVVTIASTRTVTKSSTDYNPKFQFNNSSGSYRFTCYVTGGQKNLVLYKKAE